MTRSDYFRPVRGGISGLCEEADDKSIWPWRANSRATMTQLTFNGLSLMSHPRKRQAI